MKITLFTSIFLALVSISFGIPEVWKSSTTYNKNDVVLYPEGSSGKNYIALQTGSGQQPDTSTAFWSTLDDVATGFTAPPGDPSAFNTPDTNTIPTNSPPEDNSTVQPSGLTSASNEAFVKQQYIDFLGRDADDEGLNFWLSEMAAGSKTRADVVNFFVFSDEFQNQVAPVSRLYLAYFLRPPDTPGITYWIDKMLNEMTLNEISDEFAGVQEFSDRYGSLDNSEFVNLVYENVLSRSPDNEGLTYWNGQMSGGMTRGEVMTGFSESAENQQTTLNQIRVIAFYYGTLRRAPEPEGFDYWVAKLNAGEQPNDLINGFIDSAEYQGRF